MRKLHILCFIFLAGWAFSASADDVGETYSFHRPGIKVSSEEMPKSVRSGEATLAGGLRVPMFSLSMVSGAQEGFENFTPEARNPDIRIKPEFANQLAAYASPVGTILVPKDWSVRKAASGADGSVYMLFAPDTSGQSYLSISSSGACAGCAMSSGSLYFDEARKLAKDDEFPFYRKSDIVRTARLGRFQKSYSIKVTDGNPVDGIAYFNAADDLSFLDVQISAPATMHPLATVILNQFKLSGKSDERSLPKPASHG